MVAAMVVGRITVGSIDARDGPFGAHELSPPRRGGARGRSASSTSARPLCCSSSPVSLPDGWSTRARCASASRSRSPQYLENKIGGRGAGEGDERRREAGEPDERRRTLQGRARLVPPPRRHRGRQAEPLDDIILGDDDEPDRSAAPGAKALLGAHSSCLTGSARPWEGPERPSTPPVARCVVVRLLGSVASVLPVVSTSRLRPLHGRALPVRREVDGRRGGPWCQGQQRFVGLVVVAEVVCVDAVRLRPHVGEGAGQAGCDLGGSVAAHCDPASWRRSSPSPAPLI